MAGDKTVDLKAAVSALAGRGYLRLLAEGGPHLLGQLIQADLVDELCLTIGPLVARPGPGRIVAGAPTGTQPLPLTLTHVLEDDGFLFCRYLRKDHLSRTGRRACPRARFPWSSRARQQAALEPGRYSSGAVVDAELGVDVQHVGLDRGLADEQPGGGLAVGAASGDQAEDVELALAERFFRRLPTWPSSRVATEGESTASPRAAARTPRRSSSGGESFSR